SGRSSALPCLDCIFSMVRILAIIAFTRLFFHTPNHLCHYAKAKSFKVGFVVASGNNTNPRKIGYKHAQIRYQPVIMATFELL
ncbi:MAG: hypothetical protein SOW77_03850, partial [Ruminococcus sp.]|nr:hypothetical protein [Ruminococcus sp.]